MKIFYDCNALTSKPSGVGRVSLSLLKSLLEKRQNDSFILFSFNNNIALKELSLYKNVEIRIIRTIPQKLYNLFMRWGLSIPLELLGLGGGDLYIFPDFVSYSSIIKKNKISIIHDLAFKYYPEYISHKNLKYLNRQLPKSIRRSCIILTISKSTQKDIVKYYDVKKNKVKLFSLGVDHDLFKSVAKLRVDLLKKYDIPGDFILFIGNIEPRKNIKLMIEAYIDSYSAHRLALVMVGQKGWKDDEINKTLVKYQNYPIKMLDYVQDSDLPRLYSSAKLFLYLSLYEGFGLPIIEAMACGCPVISGDSSSLPEASGGASLLIHPSTPEIISSSINKLLQDKILRKYLIDKGLEWSNNFSWDRSGAEFSKIIDDFLLSQGS